ncbi:MFS transporter [Paenibacillus sedimenti]|uniref:MFS transporter n=1 Tax=Paenibacillus sedimenti TaxID=2770274 RepID=A0A926KSC8_9BACL|nr:MFS transporter [Paenibacillus sedimenti]MBD0383209.1 MFS transporter [Paenibacillus sedimenti]
MIEYGTKAYWRATISLSLASFFVFAMVYLTQPMLPLFTQEFGISETLSSMSLSVVVFCISTCLLFYGPLSDALGRKSIMVWTMLGSILTTLLLSLVPGYSALIGLRALQGVFLAGLPSLAMAYMSEEFAPRALGISIGMYISANSLGGMSGRIIGGILADLWGWRSAFLIIGLASGLFWVCFTVMLPRSRYFRPKPLRLGEALHEMKRHIGTPSMRNAFLIGGLNFAVFIGGFNYLTFRLSDTPYNLPASVIGLLFLAYLGGTVGSTVSGRFAERNGKTKALLLGIALFGAGILMTLVPSLWVIIPGVVLQCFGYFFAHSASAGWVNANAAFARASAASLYLCSYYMGGSLGSLYLGLWWHLYRWPGVVIGELLTLGVAALLASRMRQEEKRVQYLKLAKYEAGQTKSTHLVS